jgi:DNA-binding transcriptional MocR family regulator
MTCAPELYAVETLKQAAMRALRERPELLTSAMPHNGNATFRQAVARRALHHGMRIDHEEVVVTHGCIEALNLALRAVAGPGDTIAVESPTYFGLLQALENLGMKALEIPTSPHTGISVEALELAVRTYGNIKGVVVVPNLQNPLGCIMPDEHKDKLVRLCEELRLPLIEDDAYTELADGNVPPSSLKSRDRSGNVIYCASLNKVLAPGMRLGWMNGGRWHERVKMLKFTHTRANEEWTQVTAADFIASPAYDRHLRRLRQLLKEQRERMAESIAAYFPEGTRLNVPNGGVGLWVELPVQVCSQQLFERALLKGWAFPRGDLLQLQPLRSLPAHLLRPSLHARTGPGPAPPGEHRPQPCFPVVSGSQQGESGIARKGSLLQTCKENVKATDMSSRA